MTGEPMTHPRNENEFIRAGVLPASTNNYLQQWKGDEGTIPYQSLHMQFQPLLKIIFVVGKHEEGRRKKVKKEIKRET